MPPDLARITAVREQLAAGLALDATALTLIDCALALVAGRLARHEAVALRKASIDARNAAIGRAAQHYTGSTKAKATQLREAAKVYAATAWRRHRACVSCPPKIQGRAQADLWSAMKAAPRFPFGVRQLETILAQNTPRNT